MFRLFSCSRIVPSLTRTALCSRLEYCCGGPYKKKMGGENSKFSAKRARELADSYKSKWHESTDLRWDYGRDRGPEKWWVYYPLANGDHQSPIDIVPEDAEYDTRLAMYPLRINSSITDSFKLRMKNTGYNWQVDVQDRNSYVVGGPVEKQKYYLEQFHMHWGESNHCGSEHTVHGTALSAELHFVYWNSCYSSFKDAMDKPDGLLVLAVLLKLDTVGDKRGSRMLDALTQCCDSVTFKGQSVEIQPSLNINQLMPGDPHKYWVYKGSLTTPPCYESVTWVVFHQSLPITASQLERCRHLRAHTHGEPCIQFGDDHQGYIVKNYRPVQPLGNRVIRTAEKNFTGHEEFHEQFHEQSLFSNRSDFQCQYQRQGLVKPTLARPDKTGDEE